MPFSTQTGEATVDQMLQANAGTSVASPVEQPAFKPTGIDAINPFTNGSFVEAGWRSAKSSSIASSFLQFAATSAVQRSSSDPYAGQNFNPYDMLSDEFIARHPYMLDDFQTGKVLQFENNRTAFEFYVSRKADTVENDQRLATINQGFANGTAAFIAPLLADLGPLGLAGRGAAAIARGERLVSAAEKLGLAQRMGIGAAEAGALNVASVGVLGALNDTREMTPEEYMVAAGFGVVLGGLFIPVFKDSSARLGNAGKRMAETRSAQATGDMANLISKTPTFAGKTIDQIRGEEALAIKSVLDTDIPAGDRIFYPLRTPESEPVVQAIREKWQRAGYEAIIEPHPLQDSMDKMYAAMKVEEALSSRIPGIPGALGKFTGVLNAYMPGGKLRNAASSGAQLMHETMFDSVFLTKAQRESPLTAGSTQNAEMLHHQIRAHAVDAINGMDAALAEHIAQVKSPISVTLSSGEKATVGKLGDRYEFGRIVSDFMRQTEELSRGARTAYSDNFPAAVKQAAEARKQYNRVMLDRGEQAGIFEGQQALAKAKTAADEAELDLNTIEADPNPIDPKKVEKARAKLNKANAEVERIQAFVDHAEHYLTRRYNAPEVKANPEEFVRLAVEEWNLNRRVNYKTGKPIDFFDQPLIPEALAKMDAADSAMVVDLHAKRIKAGIFNEYEQKVQEYFRRSAESYRDTIIQPDNMHGVNAGFSGGTPTQARIVQMSETRFAKFLEQDLYGNTEQYDRIMSGKISARLAIKYNEAKIAPFVEAALPGQKFDGSPEQFLKAVEADMNAVLAAAVRIDGPTTPASEGVLGKAVDKVKEYAVPSGKLSDQVKIANARALEVLKQKLEQLTNTGASGDTAGSVMWGMMGNVAMKVPFLAHMGGMPISNLTDVAAFTVIGNLSESKIMVMQDMVKNLNKMPRWGIEMFSVTAKEMGHRDMMLGDIDYIPVDARLVQSTGMKMLSKANSGSTWAAQKLSTLTGMNQMNTFNRRFAARVIMQDVIEGARRVVKAADMMDGGMSEAEALRRAGIAMEDAQRLSRLGFNASKSRELISILQKHAKDADGNKIDINSYKGLIDPNGKAWYGTNRGMYDRLAGAVNSETMNVIVEPKMLSRPLMNNTWLGRAVNQFQSFSMAWGNQLLPTVAQRPGANQAQYVMATVALGGMVDAIHNHLSGRRSFDRTAELWGTNPLGAVYKAIDRGGLMGHLGRYMNAWDALTPLSPGGLTGNRVSSSYGSQAVDPAGMTAPILDSLIRAGKGTAGIMSGGDTAKSMHMIRSILPFQNLWQINAAFRASSDLGIDNPFGGPFAGGKGVDLFPIPTRSVIQERRAAQPQQPLTP